METNQTWGIVGDRNLVDAELVDRELATLVAARGLPARVVSGGARGADTLAAAWARARGIALVEHAPKTWGAPALLARNALIVRDADLIVAFLARDSRGTRDTIDKAQKAGKPTHVIDLPY
jgi:hypothetical protein